MKKSLQITQTAVLTALLVLLQSVTKAGGQLVTGSCVNGILAIAVLFSGQWVALTVAILSPFLAFLLGVGPQLLPIVPAIAAGNVVYVLLLYFLCGKKKIPLWRQATAVGFAALGKSLILYLLVVQLLCHILPLNEKQITTFTAMFSWPQFVTAVIGGSIASLIVPILRKAFRR